MNILLREFVVTQGLNFSSISTWVTFSKLLKTLQGLLVSFTKCI